MDLKLTHDDLPLLLAALHSHEQVLARCKGSVVEGDRLAEASHLAELRKRVLALKEESEAEVVNLLVSSDS